MDNICNNIKNFRKAKGLTQDQLGKLVGTTGTAIMRYEKGKRKLDYDKMAKIAEALDISVEQLISADIENTEIQINSESEYTNSELRNTEVSLINTFRSLNESGQNKVIEYANDLNYNPKFKK